MSSTQAASNEDRSHPRPSSQVTSAEPNHVQSASEVEGPSRSTTEQHTSLGVLVSENDTPQPTTETNPHPNPDLEDSTAGGYSTTDEITLREATPPTGRESTGRESTLFENPAPAYTATSTSTIRNETPQPDLYPPYEKLAQKNPGPMEHPSMTFGPPIIILFDIVVPCIIYYVWYDIHRRDRDRECLSYLPNACPIQKLEYDDDILGYAIISFGFGEVYILIARVVRLFRERDLCAPLLSRSVWELDATSWVYGVAMLMALIPFVVGSSLEIPHLYLYSPGFLMGFLGIIMLITLIPFKIPIGINSHARGTLMRPFIYYAAEDFIAVDGLQDREFRIRYNQRYDSSKAFRRMFLVLTFWWIGGVLIYLGCLSAVIWKLEFHYAFGLSLGVLFAYIGIWAGASYWWVMRDMHRQKEAHMRGKY